MCAGQFSLLPLYGTSMATAVAAGAVALGTFTRLQLRRNPPSTQAAQLHPTPPRAVCWAVREYYTAGFYPSGVADPSSSLQPSAALLKATMTAAAVPDVEDLSQLSPSPTSAREMSTSHLCHRARCHAYLL